MKRNYSDLKETILLLEADEATKTLISTSIGQTGLKINAFQSAETALEWLKAHPNIFLLIANTALADDTGLKLFEAYRKLRIHPPFILLTDDRSRDRSTLLDSFGASELVYKPILIDSLRSQIEKIADDRFEQLEAEERENAEIIKNFIDESYDLLKDLENNLIKLENEPTNKGVIDQIFRNVHSMKGAAGAIPGGKWMARLGHAFESNLACVKKGQLQVTTAATELFLLTSDIFKKLLDLLREKAEPPADLVEAVELCIRSLDSLKTSAGAPPEQNVMQAKPIDSPKSIELAKIIPPAPDAPVKKEGRGESEGVFVTNEKLEEFMKLSGEMIILKNSFQTLHQEQELGTLSHRIVGKLADFAQTLNKSTDTLQDQIMSIRKVTLEHAFAKIPRIFRQVTQDVNKKVKLRTEGFDLAVDRTIASGLSAAMTHMLRNAIDHGIEKAEMREASGKPREGNIVITAREEKGTIFIAISDDGGGIDQARILAKALEKGLIQESQKKILSESEIYDLIFMPGFSTSETITDISGRGVGMDVVKSAIIQLNGKIRIESILRKGTTFNLEIPVPRSVVVEKTVLVKTEGTLVAVPIHSIAQLTSLSTLSVSYVGSQRTCQFQKRTILIKSYHELLEAAALEVNIPGSEAEISPVLDQARSVVIIQYKHGCLGLLVDSVHDQLEAVIRPFDKITNGFPGFKEPQF